MPAATVAVLAVWNDIEPTAEEAFRAWYEEEHVPERLGVPGFLDAWRGEAVEGTPRYCAFYDLESLAVLSTDVYLARLADPSQRTRAIMPHFRAMNRSACRVTLDQGEGRGSYRATFAISPRRGKEDTLRGVLETALPLIAHLPGVRRAQLWEADAALSRVQTTEQGLRDGPDRCADWVIAFEADAAAPLADAGAACRAAAADLGNLLTTGDAATYRRLTYRRRGD